MRLLILLSMGIACTSYGMQKSDSTRAADEQRTLLLNIQEHEQPRTCRQWAEQNKCKVTSCACLACIFCAGGVTSAIVSVTGGKTVAMVSSVKIAATVMQ